MNTVLRFGGLLLATWFGASSVTALDVLWRDGFEGFNLQLRWEISAGVWEIGNPTSGPGAPPPGGGTNVAATVLAGNYPEGADTRLVRRQSFRVPELNPRLRFQHWFHFHWDDFGQVQVRPTGGDWVTVATQPQELWSCGRWEQAVVDLAPYAGQEIQVGFLFHSQVHRDGKTYVAPGWYLDEVEVVSGEGWWEGPGLAEHFERPDFWDHWYSDNGTWEVGVPTGRPAERHDGSRAAGTLMDTNYCDAYYGRDSRLISPLTTVPAAPNPRLRFRHWFNFSWDDFGQVQVRESGGAWQTLATYPQVLWSCGRWEEASLDLTAYAGKAVQVGFLFHAQVYKDGKSYVAEGWYVDDVQVVTGEPVWEGPGISEHFERPDLWDHWYSDNGTWEVGVPTGRPAERHDGSRVAATLMDTNYCDAYFGRDSRLISPVTTVPTGPNPRLRFRHWFNFSWDDYGQVEIREPGGAWQKLVTYPQVLWTCGRWEQASLDLTAYAGKSVQLGFLCHLQVYKDYKPYVAEGWYVDDVEIVSGEQFWEGPGAFDSFDRPDVLDHWSVENGTWEVGVPTGRPAERQNGSKVAATLVDTNYCDAYYGRDSRLISPVTTVPTGPNPRLRFKHWFNFSWDDFGQVQVRESGGTWQTLAAYPQVLWSCGRWEEASLDLTAYAGKLVQVGFLFHAQVYKDGKSYVAEGWYVDDVEIVSGPMLFRNPENFEDSDFWDHWTAENGTWEVGAPTYGPTNAITGLNVAGTILDGDYCDANYGRDSRLVSPRFWVPTRGTPTLRFQHWHNFNLDDYGAIEVRAAEETWEELQRFSGTSNGKWYGGSQLLTNYLGREIQFGFRFHSQYNKNGKPYVAPGWYLDQLEIHSGLLWIQPEEILWSGLSVREGDLATFQATGAPEGYAYGLAAGSPKGATIDRDLGIFSWLPEECQGPGWYFITVTLLNVHGQVVDLLEVPVFVEEVPADPVIQAIPAIRLRPGLSLELDVASKVSDPDCPAQALTYSLDQGSPDGAVIDPQSGWLRWTPTADQAGQTNTILLRVTDETGRSANRAVLAGPFDVSSESNEAPTFRPIPALRLAPFAAVTLDAAAFVTDADAPPQRLVYRLLPPSPTNASMNPVTGRLEWNPTPRQAAGNNTLAIRVTDEGGLCATQSVEAAGDSPSGPGPFITVRLYRYDPDSAATISVVMWGDVGSPPFELLQSEKLPASEQDWSVIGAARTIPAEGFITYDLFNPSGTRFFRLRLESP